MSLQLVAAVVALPYLPTHPPTPHCLAPTAEFVEVLDRGHVRMVVWERGAGRTLACGTGACATVVAGVLEGRTDRKCQVCSRVWLAPWRGKGCIGTWSFIEVVAGTMWCGSSEGAELVRRVPGILLHIWGYLSWAHLLAAHICMSDAAQLTSQPITDVAATAACCCTRCSQVDLPGGPLLIEWSEEDNHVYMTGPAELVFQGTVQV